MLIKIFQKIGIIKSAKTVVVFFGALFAGVGMVTAQKLITVNAATPVAEIQPTMWGVFFEDINMGADGGIYAELVKNRSFEFYKPMMGWKPEQKQFHEGRFQVINRQGSNLSNPRFLRVKTAAVTGQDLGLINEGFRGMGVKEGVTYHFSVMYRQPQKGLSIRIQLLDSSNKSLGETVCTFDQSGEGWFRAKATVTATATHPKARMAIWFEGEGTIDFDMISLFPNDTWKNRPGGMRADMIQLLADMQPGFIRFPGGCIVEGHDLSVRYQWKKTIGPVEDRQLIINRWNAEFAHRPTPDYFQTFGLGFFEYFQLAEDIGAQPLPILNCGMACQFNTAEVVPMDELDPYIQDALDLIEFANGDTNTTWGKKRASFGHPAPFGLSMIGMGNENWGPQYVERLIAFQQAIKEKYPDIKIVASAGTDPNGERFDFLNEALRKAKVDIIDEHYYRRPEWFLQNAARYDRYDRNGAKIFAGEYAAQSDKVVSVHNRNNLQTAIAEAAFLTGLERNAGVVSMASYAPLFAHVEGWQWTPDLIWVDNLRAFGTPNYYVQKLFATNRGTHVIPALSDGQPLTGQDSLYVSAVKDSGKRTVIVKVVNAGSKARSVRINITGVKTQALATTQVLTGQALDVVNTLANPKTVSPVAGNTPVKNGIIAATVQPNTLTVFEVAAKF